MAIMFEIVTLSANRRWKRNGSFTKEPLFGLILSLALDLDKRTAFVLKVKFDTIVQRPKHLLFQNKDIVLTSCETSS